MASPPRVENPDNLPGLMHPIMQRYQLQPKDIKKDKRQQVVPGKGEFFCVDCSNKWHSYFSWIQFDLFDQRVVKRWSMKCKECLEELKPTFSIPEMEKLIEKAVCMCLDKEYEGRQGKRGRIREFFVQRQPHASDLCEKCGYGKLECWVQWRNKQQ